MVGVSVWTVSADVYAFFTNSLTAPSVAEATALNPASRRREVSSTTAVSPQRNLEIQFIAQGKNDMVEYTHCAQDKHPGKRAAKTGR